MSTNNQSLADLLLAHHCNVSQIPAEQVRFDLATDSWSDLALDEVSFRSEALQVMSLPEASLRSLLADLFPFRYFSLLSRGRLAEYMLTQVMAKSAGVVPQNLLWLTTRYHQVRVRLTPQEVPQTGLWDRTNEDPFQGGIDLLALEKMLTSKGAKKMAYVCVEPANNASGGFAMPMVQMRALSTLVKAHKVPLVLDATRILGNALFIRSYEAGFEDQSVWDIVREFCAYADGMTLSLTKDFGIDNGALLALNDERMHTRIQDQILVMGNGLSHLDETHLRKSLADREATESYFLIRWEHVRRLYRRLRSADIPLATGRCGYHCVLLDVFDFLDANVYENPVPAFLAWVFEHTGIRMEHHATGMQHEYANKFMVRLAVPFGMVDEELDALSERLVEALERLLSNQECIFDLHKVSQESGVSGVLTATYEKRRLERTAPLSFSQRRLWLLNQIEPGDTAYNIAWASRIQGPLRLDRLQQAVRLLVQRQEILRTTFAMQGDDPVQVVKPCIHLDIPVEDLSGLAEKERCASLRARFTALAQRPFDLQQGALLRIHLYRLAEDEYVMLLGMHHIITDGWSLGLFAKEMGALYGLLQKDSKHGLPPLPMQYSGYAEQLRDWLTEKVENHLLHHWRQQLANLPDALELPTDRPRGAYRTTHGARHFIKIPATIAEALKVVGKRYQSTLFMVLLGAFKVLLMRYTGQEDILVGTPIANRNRQGIAGLMGFFVNTLVLRTHLTGQPSFGDLLSRIREMTLKAYKHQELPFERLVEAVNPERSLGHTPLFQVMFTFQNVPLPDMNFADLTLSWLNLSYPRDDLYAWCYNDTGMSMFELTLELIERPEGVVGAFEYNTDLFDATTIERMAQNFQTLLQSIVENPACPISVLPLLTKAEQQQILVEWNQTERDFPKDLRLNELFEAQASQSPKATALVYENRSFSYATLNVQANQLAHYLREQEVVPNQVVAVFTERSPEMVVALLGILKAGAGYLPLDPSYPEERLRFMLSDAKVQVVLSQQAVVEPLPKGAADTVLLLDKAEALLANQPENNPVRNTKVTDLAYMIYTSGSTGKPKGVMIQHQAIVNHMQWMQERFPLTNEDKVLQKTPFSFDASVWEFWAPLQSGAQLVMAHPEGHQDGEYLTSMVVQAGITVMQTVPSLLRILLAGPQPERLGGLKRLFCGGEALPVDLVTRTQALGIEVVNLYGPTECTIDASYHLCHAGRNYGARIPIGRPISNLQAYVLDAYYHPVPIGVSGELFLAGQGLAKGYYRREQLTEEAFIKTSFDPKLRLYRTGDRVRWLVEGQLDYIGRIDHQVKLRGFRIELGEIESQLAECKGVYEAVVVVREDVPGDQRLVAYVIPEPEAFLTLVQLRDFLKDRLADYMVPSAFVCLDKFPFSPSGKLDHKALPLPDTSLLVDTYIAARTPLEEDLTEIWVGVLNVDRIGVHDNFFELGGHSLLATLVTNRIREAFGVELPLRVLFESPTISGLSEWIASHSGEISSPERPTLTPVPRDGAMPLSFAQQRLWFLEQLEPGTAFYNMPAALHIQGKLNIEVLQQVFTEIVQRHEILRTTYQSIAGETRQKIHKPTIWPLPLEDLRQLPESRRQEEAARRIREEAQRPFDLETGPLFRTTLLQLAEEEYRLLATMHHIASDGWSSGVLIREVGTLYAALVAGKPSPMQPLPVQYADFAHWQRKWLQGAVLEAQLDYWKGRLQGAPALLNLPTDRPRPEVQTLTGTTFTFQLPQDLSEALLALSKNQKVTLFMTLLAGYQILLSRYSGQQDICVGVPIAGRQQAQTEVMIGFFVNALVLRTQWVGNPNVSEYLQQLRNQTLGAYAHQDLPFEMLVDALQPERNLSYAPLAQVGFSLQNAPMGALALPDMQIELMELDSGTAKYDLTWMLEETLEGIRGTVEFNTGLFDHSTIETMVTHYQHLLGSLVRNPEGSIDSLSLFSEKALYNLLNLRTEDYECIQVLTAMQRDLYLESRIHPETVQNSLGLAVEVHKPIDRERWRKGLEWLAAHNSILRSRFAACEAPFAEVAYQVVARVGDIDFRYEDLSTRQLDEATLETYLRNAIYRPYQVSSFGHLVRHRLMKLGEQRYVVLIAAHHAILDGVAVTGHMLREFALYESLTQDEKPPEGGDVFSEYITFNRQHFDQHTVYEYWQAQFQGVEPLDFPLAEVGSGQEINRQQLLDDIHWAAVKRFCRRQRITPALYFKCLFGLLLQQYCRAESDFSIQEFISGRPRGHSDTLGCYYQQIPFLFRQNLVSGEGKLAALFAYAREQQRGLGENQYISILDQHRLTSQGRLHFSYNYYHFSATLDFMGEQARIQQYRPPIAEGQIQLIIKVIGTTLELNLHYHNSIFQDLDFLPRLVHLSHQAIAGCEYIRDLSYITEAEVRQQLVEWNATEHEQPPYNAVQEMFEAQATRSPTAEALRYGEQVMDYQTLNQRANQLAHYLRTLGVDIGDRVSLCVQRSPEMLVGVLGILKAGAAYIPMDPSYPRERLAYMLSDSGSTLLLTQQGLIEMLPNHSGTTLCLDRDWPNITKQSKDNPTNRTRPNDLLYIIYTSGSTGRPKGAQVIHCGELNLLQWYTKHFTMQSTDRVLLMSAFGFDLTQKNLFAPLVAGAGLILPEREDYDSDYLRALIKTSGVTWINSAPSAFYPLVETCDRIALQTLRYVFLGGEPIALAKLTPWLCGSDCLLVNSYGPTECTDIAASHTLAAPSEYANRVVPIGRPNYNVRLYVFNKDLQPLPQGLVGELYIAGTSVGIGYLHDEEKTATSFLKHPYEEESQIYRTGDLVRYRPNGELEYIGRRDFQVKLRGLRIELGEIEYALEQQSEVQDSLVLVRDEQLIAYLLSSAESLDLPILRSALAEYLPQYMIPAAYIPLTEWPLTPNGKIDRKALPEPDRAGTFIAPRNPMEEAVADIWIQILGQAKVGVQDNFFALGGHSLLATQVISRIRDVFEVDLELRSLFEVPTVAGLVKKIEVVREMDLGISLPPLVPVERSGALALSFAQQRLWFLDQLQPGTAFYNMPAALHITGKLDREALQRVFQQVVMRHEVLRTDFFDQAGEPGQRIHAPKPWVLPLEDLSELSGTEQDAKLKQRAEQEAQQPFPLNQAPLLRTVLLYLEEQQHVLLLTMHHIVSDGWSLGILVREVAALYVAELENRPTPLPTLAIQYADFAHWQRQWLQGDVLEAQLAYWREHLKDTTILELSTDFPRPAVQSYQGAHLPLQISSEVTTRLRAIAKRQGATLYMVLLAAFNSLLYRYTGQQDLCVGTPVANRPQGELESLIGFFVNTLALRSQVQGEQSFITLLEQVREVTLGAYAHQDTPFERLVDELGIERDMTHAPLFQVMFSMQNLPQEAIELPGLRLTPMPVESATSKFDLLLDMREQGDCLEATLEYATDLFAATSIERMTNHLQNLLAGIAAQPERNIAEQPLLSETERQQLLQGWNNTVRDYPQDLQLHQLFEVQAARTPDHPAVSFENQTLRYADLNGQANRLAHYLRDKGVGPNQIVGVFTERSLEMVIALFGILKAGGAYLPLDPSYPKERLRFMLEDSQVAIVLTQQTIAEALPKQTGQVIVLDQATALLENQPENNPEPNTKASDLAYVIYTSGSTGRPKGVLIPHQAIVNHMQWMQERFPLGEKDCVLQKTPFSFDASVWEFYAALQAGGQLVMARPEGHQDGDYLLATIEQAKITILQTVPSLLRILLAGIRPERLTNLKRLYCGGEALPADLVRQAQSYGIEVINLYGPTECTIDATYHLCQPITSETERVPIGQPIANLQAYVLDRDGNLAPIGVAGELHLGGQGLARGYHQREELTKQTFVTSPLHSNTRLYRTGDRVRWLPEGTLDYLSRMDHQVKLRGFRIELGEIEAQLTEHTGLHQAVVLVREDTPGDQRLVAYVVAEKGQEPPEVNELRSFLKERLADYMVPSAFIPVDTIPLSPSGKVDRKALPSPEPSMMMAGTYIAPRNTLEEELGEVWSEVLGLERVGVYDNFFDLGGHSLLATQVVSRVRSTFQVELSLRKLFETPTIAAIAEQIERDRGIEQSGVIPPPLSKIEPNAATIISDINKTDELEFEDGDDFEM